MRAVNGVAHQHYELPAKSGDSAGWSEVTSSGSPRCEPDASERLADEDEEELLNDEEEHQSQDRMSGASSSPRSQYDEEREVEWEPLSLAAKGNGSETPEDLTGGNGHIKEEPPSDLSGLMGRAGVFQVESFRYRPLPAEEDGKGEAERPARLDGWALGLHEMSRGRVNFSLLEQAIALQTEQRQALHHAYREMDRFLMEQMSHERRHQRMMEMDGRLSYHGGKGNRPDGGKNSNNNKISARRTIRFGRLGALKTLKRRTEAYAAGWEGTEEEEEILFGAENILAQSNK